MFARVAFLVFKKDFAIELKSYEILATTLFFAIACVVIFSFALAQVGDAMVDAAAGVLWIAVAFAGTLALGRTFERERYGDTLKGLLLAPTSRAAVYVGKLLGIVTLMLAWRSSWPLVALLFHAPLFNEPVRLVRSSFSERLATQRWDALRGDAGPQPHARRDAAHPVVSNHHSGNHCGS
jgi:ABC-type transport system involved in cytochrome c biogenesis permease component